MIVASVVFICVNSGCTMSLIDCEFLKTMIFTQVIKKMTVVSVCEIEISQHFINKFITINIYLSDYLNSKNTTVCLWRKVHLINNLNAKLLLKVDILGSEMIIMNFHQNQIILLECQNMTISMVMSAKSKLQIRHMIWIKNYLIISADSEIKLLMILKCHVQLSDDRDFLFESEKEEIYFLVVNINFNFVFFCNHSELSITLSRNMWMRTINDFEKEECHLISKQVNKTIKPETTLLNEIIIYRKTKAFNVLHSVVQRYSDLWVKNKNTVDVSEKKWLFISLASDWNASNDLKLRHRVYSLRLKDCVLVDEKCYILTVWQSRC